MEYSYNGWRASQISSAIGVAAFTVGGVSFPAGVKSGDVATVLRYVAEQFHARVEPLRPGWCWGYNYRKNRNANNLSCHSSGTAIDLNAPNHPNGKRGTFSSAQVKSIRAILSECGGVVQWGGDYTGTPDEMHFEIIADAAQVKAVADRIRSGGQLSTITTSQEDFLMALSQMDQEETRNNVRNIAAAVSTIQEYLKVPGQPFGYPAATHNALGALITSVNALAGKVGTADIDEAELAKHIAESIPADLAEQVSDELAKRLAS